jgi:integrase
MMRGDRETGGRRGNGPAPAQEALAPMQGKRNHAGIRVRHAKNCPASNDAGQPCRCSPSYEAWVYSARDGKKIRESFPTLAAAKGWRADATSALRKGAMRAPSQVTLREAATAWLQGAKAGLIRNRSGDAYKPSVLRSYEAALEARILPELGARRLSEISRVDVQDLADRLIAEGLTASTIRNTLMPLRVIFRRAVSRGEVAVNPTTGLELPAVRGRRDRIASPEEAAQLIAAAPKRDQALWATALYAGLRRGELMALRWEDVDLSNGVIRVERSWDVREGVVEPKSRAGKRKVPIASVLRDYLIEHKLASGCGDGLVFGRSPTWPFNHTTILGRAHTAWKKANAEEARAAEAERREPRVLEPIGLHEARHTFASLMIAAGVNAKALATYMGHSSITVTLDRYGHLMPGNENEAAGLLDAYLERARPQARLAQIRS